MSGIEPGVSPGTSPFIETGTTSRRATRPAATTAPARVELDVWPQPLDHTNNPPVAEPVAGISPKRRAFSTLYPSQVVLVVARGRASAGPPRRATDTPRTVVFSLRLAAFFCASAKMPRT